MLPRALRLAAIRRGFRVDEAAVARLEVRLARTEAEHEAAHRLLHAMYVRRGLMSPHPSGIRVTPQQLLPASAVFIALAGDAVVGTMSLNFDSPLGLSMDDIYPDELGALRARGRRLAEVGALCLAPAFRGTGAMYLLSRIMIDHAQDAARDDLVIAVHPEVADYYCANMLFEQIGPVRCYPGLDRSALAVAMRLDVRTMHARAKRVGLDALWFARANPQVTPIDRSEVGLRRHLAARRASALHMTTVCPEVLDDLAPHQREHLALMVPALAPALEPGRAGERHPRADTSAVLEVDRERVTVPAP